MNDFADFQAEDMGFDTFWDVISADDVFLAPFDDREDDGWSERYDFADEIDPWDGGEDAFLDSWLED